MKQILHLKSFVTMMLLLICVNGAWGQTTFEKVLGVDQLVVGSKYIIVNETAKVAMGEQRKNNRGQISVQIANNQISINGTSVAVLTLGGSKDRWTFHDGKGYLYAASSSSNNLKTHASVDDNSKAIISISSSGEASIKFIGKNVRNTLMYNSSSRLFSCYSSGQKTVQLYVEKAGGNPALQDQTLSFGETTSFEVVEGGTFTAPVLTGAKTTVTYESSNTKVATVDGEGHVVLAGALGTTTITANAAANETYNAASASYTLTVKAAPKMVQNIAEFLQKKDTKNVYTFANPVIVVKQYQSDLWIKDESGFINVHGNLNQTYKMGDEIPAGVSGKYSEFKGTPQIGSAAGFKAASKHGLEVLPIEMQVGDITNADINKYVILKGVKFVNGNLESSDKKSILYHDKFDLNNFPQDGNQYDVIAIVNHYNALQVLPISWTEVPNNKKDQTLSFPAAEYNATMGDAFIAPKVEGDYHTTVTYSSLNEKVATVDPASGDVTLVGEGTATITATAEATTEYNGASASYLLHVAKAEGKGEVLPYRQVGDLSDLSENFTPENVGIYKNDPEANLKFADSGVKLTMKLAEAPASLSYAIRWNGSGTFGEFVVETSVDGQVYKDLKTYTNDNIVNGNSSAAEYFPLDENVRYIRWTYVRKAGGNIGLGSIFVTKKGDVTAYPVKMSAVKHATFFADEAVVIPAGLTANYATINNALVKLAPKYNAGDVLPANTPVVLTGEAANYELGKTLVKGSEDSGANALRGALTNEVVSAQAGEKFYILANDADRGLGFYFQGKTSEGLSVVNMANKAYLVATGAAATVLGFAFEGDATGIEGVAAEKADEAIYTLSGVRVNADKNSLPKGIYIIGGKKVLVK